MAEYTTNYNLEKQQGNDNINIDGINNNFDIIDEELAKRADLIDGKIPSNQLPEMNYAPKENPQFTGIATLNGNEIATVNDIPSGLSLGETSSTAYRGDRGKIAYDHSQTTHAPTNAQKNSDITKAEIEAKLTGQISTHSHVSDSSKAPTNHASANNAYGLGTGALYGHVSIYNYLDKSSYAEGQALSAYQGKVLNDKIINLESKKIIVVNYIDYTKENPAKEYAFDDIILKFSTDGDGVNGRINTSVKLPYNAEIMYYRQGNDFSSGFRTATANTFTAIVEFPSNGDRPIKADIYYNGKLKTLYFYVTTDGMVSFYRGNVVLA